MGVVSFTRESKILSDVLWLLYSIFVLNTVIRNQVMSWCGALTVGDGLMDWFICVCMCACVAYKYSKYV